MDLYISGGTHVDTDVDSRIESIEDALGEPDVVFLEDRVSNQSKKKRIINWIAAPTLFVSLRAILLFYKITTLFLQTDDEIIEKLQSKYKLEVYKVDKPVHEIIGSQRQDWALANWSLLVLPVAFVYFPLGMVGVSLALATLIIGAISVTMSYLCSVHAERNVYIMNKIVEVAKNNEHEKACVITGGKHDSNLRQLAYRFEGVELADRTKR